MIEDYDKEFVLNCAPVFTLNEILPLKKASDLKKMCMFSNISGLEKMSKNELIPLAYKVGTNENEFKNILYGMEENMWEFLKTLIKDKYIEYNDPFPDDFYNMKFFGIVQIFHFKNKQFLVVPEEIRNMYNNIVTEEFERYKHHFKNIENYAIASANFYKIISFKCLTNIYNEQNEDKTSENDMFSCLIKHFFVGKGYFITPTHIVSEEYEGVEADELEKFENETRNMPRYVPDKNEFLKYKNESYYENIPQIQAFRDYLKSICDDEANVNGFVDEVLYIIRNEDDTKNIFDILEVYDIKINYNQVDEFGKFILDIMKNTRFWTKKGYTLNELSYLKRTKSNFKVLRGNNKEKRTAKRKKKDFPL